MKDIYTTAPVRRLTGSGLLHLSNPCLYYMMISDTLQKQEILLKRRTC